MTEHARARSPAREHADELDRVDLDALTADALRELAARGTLEHELEGLTVDRRPFSDDVRDEAAVVLGGELHGPVDGGMHVDAVRPHVAREADIEEILQRLPADRRAERDRQVPHGRRRAPAALHRLRANTLELGDDLVVREIASFA